MSASGTGDDSDLFNDVETVVNALGLELVSFKVIPRKSGPRVEIAIFHRERGIAHEDCQAVDHALEEMFNERWPEGWGIEVGSPGLGRELKTEREYRIFTGRPVEFAWKSEPGQYHRAVLAGYADGSLSLEVTEGEIVSGSPDDFNRIRLI